MTRPAAAGTTFRKYVSTSVQVVAPGTARRSRCSPGDRVPITFPRGYVGIGVVEIAAPTASEFTVMTDHGEQSVMDVVQHGASIFQPTRPNLKKFVKVKCGSTR